MCATPGACAAPTVTWTMFHFKIHLVPHKMHHSKTKSIPCINTSRASYPSRVRQFLGTLRTSLGKGCLDATSADSKWKHVRTAL